MKGLVRRGYEEGRYEKAFGRNRELGAFERDFFGAMEKNMPSGGRILDLGCGTGVPYDSHLAGKGFLVTGVDFTPKHVKRARENVRNAEFILGDLADVDFGPCSFDGVVSLYSLFHLPRSEHETVFNRMYRCLKPGGLLLLTLGTDEFEYSDEENWAGVRVMAWSSLNPDQYLKMLSGKGFDVLLSRYQGKPGDKEYHFWVLLRKHNCRKKQA